MKLYNEQELEKKRKFVKLAALVLFGAVSFMVAPFVFLMIKGAVGLILAGVIGLTGINLSPVFADKSATSSRGWYKDLEK